MISKKIVTESCCGSKGISVAYKIDRPIDKSTIQQFVSAGYVEYSHFTLSGILYVDNSEFIITGPIGSNRLTLKCKNLGCQSKIMEVEDLINNME